ncbi:hypothetical protein DMH01_03335 [Amycolatopsis sp. WAC 04182]|uniref:hypothetical protein n=1 Tax=Amycolatopsis sp. WAC 04182 TaxID=2203198 RepID=UPI000F78FC53|nr:hypothetical protein [Amycolatopsis sp. WAC 04182]RSN65424.1 hypothetical protein DMH01_03335 [Amycolatopsis sp. WAC 04182]
MAPTALAYSNLVPNSDLADPAGVATVAGAGNGVKIPSITAGATRSFPELTVLRVSNASGGSGTVTIKAGAYPPAIAAGQGDLTVTVANAATRWIGPFESGRFLQSDGSLLVESSVVMTVTAFKVPRNT